MKTEQSASRAKHDLPPYRGIPNLTSALIVYSLLASMLFVLILIGDFRQSRFSPMDYELATVAFLMGLVFVFLVHYFLKKRISTGTRNLSFRWSILLLILGFASLLASFDFLVSIPNDSEEGWAILSSSIFYPFFVLFLTMFFQFWDTERRLKKTQTKSPS